MEEGKNEDRTSGRGGGGEEGGLIRKDNVDKRKEGKGMEVRQNVLRPIVMYTIESRQHMTTTQRRR